jgi:hypothetical protein
LGPRNETQPNYLGFAEKGLGWGQAEGSEAARQEFQALLPCFLYQFVYCTKDNARFLKVPILFSQHEHRILTGQKPYFKRFLPLFSNP